MGRQHLAQQRPWNHVGLQGKVLLQEVQNLHASLSGTEVSRLAGIGHSAADFPLPQVCQSGIYCIVQSLQINLQEQNDGLSSSKVWELLC